MNTASIVASDRIAAFPIEENRIMVKRSDLFRRIRNMIVIMSDLTQEPVFAHLEGVTIPYYAVGVDEEITQELRSFFAEMILMATFEYPAFPNQGICGVNMSRLPKISIELAFWAGKKEYHLSMAERDAISPFCNPTRYIVGEGLCAWGSGGYVSGQWYANLVTAASIKYLLGFGDLTHMVVYDDN